MNEHEASEVSTQTLREEISAIKFFILRSTPPPEKETPETPPLNRICTPSNARQTTYDWE